MSIAIGDNDIS